MDSTSNNHDISGISAVEDSAAPQFIMRSVNGKHQHIIAEDTLVGREVECHIHLDQPQISRYHAKLYVRDDKLYVRDLHSSNGTYVNGKEITTETELQLGDEIAFNETIFRITTLGSGSKDETVIRFGNPNATQATPNSPTPIRQVEVALSEAVSRASIRPALEDDNPAIEPSSSQSGDESKNEPEVGSAIDTPQQPPLQNDEKPTVFLMPDKHDFLDNISGVISDSYSGPRIIALTAPIRGKCFPLETDEDFFTWSIGRNEYADIEIHNESASRLHAWITKLNGVYEIKEENATNGLLVNGERVQQTILSHNDLIRIGSSAFLFRIQREEPEDQQNPSAKKGILYSLRDRLLGLFKRNT